MRAAALSLSACSVAWAVCVENLFAPVFALAVEHPSGVFRRQATDLVELFEFGRAQGDLRGCHVVGELLGTFRADDDTRDLRSRFRSCSAATARW